MKNKMRNVEAGKRAWRRRMRDTLNWCLAAESSLRAALASPSARSYWEDEAFRQLEGALGKRK